MKRIPYSYTSADQRTSGARWNMSMRSFEALFDAHTVSCDFKEGYDFIAAANDAVAAGIVFG